MKFKTEENVSFFPHCVLENNMMTSLLADKSVIVKIKMIMNFMNEIINTPCNSLLAAFFESSCKVCPKTVSASLRRIARPKRTMSQLFKLFFPFTFCYPRRTCCWRERRGESVGGPEGPKEVGGVCKTDAGTEADVEDEDEEFEVVGGVDEFGVFGNESEGFTLSEILRRKRLEKIVSESVVDTAHLPQCEFSNLHQLPLALLLENLCSPVNEFYWASYAARWNMKMTS